MTLELRRSTINLKSLNQDISDSVVVGAGDANGRTLAVILTQEAAARFTPSTRLYLSWKHNDTNVQGLDVFTKVSDKPQTWEIHFPQEMLHKGTVLACLKIIDEVSVDCSTNFLITILADPNEVDRIEDNDNYSIFKQAALELNNTNDRMLAQLAEQKKQFDEMMEWLKKLPNEVQQTLDQKIGILPDGVPNYLVYVQNIKKEQDKQIKEEIESVNKSVEEQIKDVTLILQEL